MEERLQKVMARYGVASRRKCEELISTGRVTVNGKIVTELGSKVDWERDQITVDGNLIQAPEPKVYLVLNKPRGYVTTVSDPQKRKKVIDLIKGVKQRVYPVGRLDYDTEGLLLLTNDGDLALAITHPRHNIDKTYLARVTGYPSGAALRTLRNGVPLSDGQTSPAAVRKLTRLDEDTLLEIIIHEGKNRQVRRMCAAVGHPVLELKRIRVGPINLEGLGVGQYRHLTDMEVGMLRRLAGI